MKVKILGRYVLPITSEPLENAGLLIEDGIITRIGPRREIARLQADLVVDGNLLVMPGLVNTHCHAAMVGFRGLADDLPLMEWLQNSIWPMENSLVTPEFIRIAVKLALLEMIKGGTTLFADMYFFQHEAAKAVEEAGIRAVLGEGTIDFPTPAAKTPENQLAIAEDFIRNWIGHPLVTPTVAPHAPYSTSPEVYQKSRDLAQKYDVPLLTHIAETRDEVRQIQERYGTTPVRHLDRIGVLYDRVVAAHSVWLDDEETEIYLKRGVGVAHCPESNMKLASGVAPIGTYLQKGVKVSLATDGACSNNDLDMIGEMRTAALLHKVHTLDPTQVTARQVVEMATLGGARVLGMDQKIGSLEVGKEADVITLDLSAPHLTPAYDPYSLVVYSAKATDVRDVFVRGNPILLDREVQTLSEEEVLEEARRHLEQPIRRKLRKLR